MLLITAQAIAQFAKGADIGWLSEMEAHGKKFYDDAGKEKNCLQILKEHCINSVRLRVWVNPAGGWSGKEDVIAQALRAKDMGFRIMINFHYSDFWAGPGKQYKPNAWEHYTFEELVKAVNDHTHEVMTALANKGIYPEWVQVGNETNNGMLWEDGRASYSMSNFAALINSGYDAIKAVSSSSKVIIHLSSGYDNGLFRWMFDGLKEYNAKWDVIGMSLYPLATNWQILTQQCLYNMNDMVMRYGKEVMISEIGMDYHLAETSKAFISDIISKTRSLPGEKGLGVFYWEPQTYNWKGYLKGAWDLDGKPTIAMDAFLADCDVTTDCMGVFGGTAFTDTCGNCTGGTSGKLSCSKDCHGDWGGTAIKDNCGICSGGNTGLMPCFGSIQGEAACEDGDGTVESVNDGYLGEGYYNFFNFSGASSSWNLYIQQNSYVTLSFRYTNGSFNYRNLAVIVNGEVQVNSLYFPSTGTWNNWKTVHVVLNLKAGYNNIKLQALSTEGGPNIDLIAFNTEDIQGASCSLTPISANLPDNVGLYPNPFTTSLIISDLSEYQYSIQDIAGRFIESGFCSGTCTVLQEAPAGMYIITFTKTGFSNIYKVFKK